MTRRWLTDDEIASEIRRLIAAGRLPAWVEHLKLRCDDPEDHSEDVSATRGTEAS